MSEDIIYDVSDSEDETEMMQGNNASLGGKLDPELLFYLDHLPSIKVEEDKIQEIVERYICDEYKTQIKSEEDEIQEIVEHYICDEYKTQIKSEEDEIQEIVERYMCDEYKTQIKSEVPDIDESSSDKDKTLYDIYADPIPSCSYQTVEIPKIQNGPSIQVPSTLFQKEEEIQEIVEHYICDEYKTQIKSEEDKIQEIVERYICDEYKTQIKSEVPDIDKSSSDKDKTLYDIYADPIPSCSHQTVEIPKVSSGTYENLAPGCSHHLDSESEWPVIIRTETISPSLWCEESNEVTEPLLIENIEEESKKNLETPAVTDTSGSTTLLSKPVEIKDNEIADNSLNNSIFVNIIERSIHQEPLQSLILLYRHINGLHNARTDLNQDHYYTFCEKIVKINLDHSLLIEEIEKGNLIKFERLVVWGRNMKRNVEDLIKEAKPHGCIFDEAQKFVFKMLYSESRYRQRLADDNESYIFDDTDHYKFHCMACNRRDDNLTWLVAHLCRDTSEMIYMCCFCGFIFFNNICALIYHVVLDLLEGSKKEYCVECQGFFPSVANHLMNIEGSWKVRCVTCDFISFSQCSLSIHQRYHKMEKHHACPECGCYFIFIDLLENHLKNVCYFNAKKVRHICPLCAIIFKDEETLFRHLLCNHHHRMIKCIQCHMLLSNRIQYISHRAKNHPESPCTYQICHTCTLCPGCEFKTSAAQIHIKNHATDVTNAIVLYVCDCNYFTIHKHNFIEHKAQNCEASPTFGKWDNDHEMKICGQCNDIRFTNLSEPFVCENCDVLNDSQQGNSSLTKTYECKVCKLFLIYKWEAVIEHFYRFHPTISLTKFSNCVKSTYISGSNNDLISFSDQINSHHSAIDNEILPVSSFSDFSHIASSGKPKKNLMKLGRNNIFSCATEHNIKNTLSVGKKTIAKKKCKPNNVPLYQNISHFMASNSLTPSNQVRVEYPRKNIAPISPNINVLSIRRLENPVSMVDTTVSQEDDMLQLNDTSPRPDRSLIDVSQTNNSMSCASSCGDKKEKPKTGKSLCAEDNIMYGLITPNQSHADNTAYSLIKMPETSDKPVFKGNIAYVKRKIDSNNFDQPNSYLDENPINNSPEDSTKAVVELNSANKKSLECKKCQYKCNEALELVKHFTDAHYIQNTYQCMECGECFANLKNKINHLKSTHKIDTKCYLEPDINRLETCGSKYRCPVCLRGFLSDQDKNLHMRCHGMAYLQSIKSISKEM